MPWWFEALGECPAPIPALPPAADRDDHAGTTTAGDACMQGRVCSPVSARMLGFGFSAEGSGSAGGGERALLPECLQVLRL